MKLKQLKEADERFGHKAGDIFLVDDADYDSDKFVGFKVLLVSCDNSFYKVQMKAATVKDLEVIATELLEAT